MLPAMYRPASRDFARIGQHMQALWNVPCINAEDHMCRVRIPWNGKLGRHMFA